MKHLTDVFVGLPQQLGDGQILDQGDDDTTSLVKNCIVGVTAEATAHLHRTQGEITDKKHAGFSLIETL